MPGIPVITSSAFTVEAITFSLNCKLTEVTFETVEFAAGVEPDEVTRRRLRARGVELVGSPVTEIAGEGAAIEAVRTADGTAHLIDALFTVAQPRTHGAFLSHLDLARNETPFGSYLAVDQAGKTSDDGIWAAGNVVNPMANVPMSIGAGAFAGPAVNGRLVEEEFDLAVAEVWS